jgi:hypothetical protein
MMQEPPESLKKSVETVPEKIKAAGFSCCPSFLRT